LLLHLKLRRFDIILARRLNRYLQVRTDLDRVELSVLVTASEEERSQIEIANLLEIHPNVMTQIVRRLVKLRYAERQKDRKDRRRLLLVPSPAGISLVKRIKRNSGQLLRVLLHPLSDEQIEQLEALVTKLVDGQAEAERLWELEGLGSRLSIPPREQKLHDDSHGKVAS
jgi:DNA-binding MarR family transcriptional regulator